MKKRFIEISFPLQRMSELSQSEKTASSKTLALLHTWWARKPQTLSRAIISSCILAAPDSEEKRKEIEGLLERACTLDAYLGGKSPSIHYQKLMMEIKQEFRDHSRPVFLDPFAGGGSIPFEARRLGLDVFSNDLNPVSFLIRKAGLELLPELWKKESTRYNSLNMFFDDFDKWSFWLHERVNEEIGQYFEEDTLTYIWVKTCHCKSCGREIPLLNMKLSRRKGKIVNPQVIVDKKNGTFKIELSSSEPSILRTTRGAICPFCEVLTTTLDDIKEEGKARGLGSFPVCKYIEVEGGKREFRPLTDEDLNREKEAKAFLEKIKSDDDWHLFIPNEQAPASHISQPYAYGLDTFDKFYSPRQLLTIITLMRYVSLSFTEMVDEGMEEGRAQLITLLLSFVVDKFATKNSLLSTWDSGGLSARSMFAGPQFRMSRDYIESSPIRLSGGGSLGSSQKFVKKAVMNCMIVPSGKHNDNIGSVTNLKYPDESIDLVFTDPPYLDYIIYSSLSDFFYVLLKRMLRVPFADIFQTPLTPKRHELVLSKKTSEGIKELELGLLDGWIETHRVLKKDGLCVVTSPYKSIGDEEQILRSLYRAGFYAVAIWPILSERVSRYNQGRANANRTLLIVCRKRDIEISKIGNYREVKEELQKTTHENTKRFLEQGLSYSDVLLSILGPAMEVFARYNGVERSSGEQLDLFYFLRVAQQYVGDFMLNKLFNFKMPEDLDNITRFYIMYRYLYGISDVSVNDYLSLCRAMSIDNNDLKKLGFIEKGTVQRSEIHLNQYYERALSFVDWKHSLRNPSIITRLHLGLYLLSLDNSSSFHDFVNSEGITDKNHVIVQVGYALEVIFSSLVGAGGSISELLMLQKFLSTFEI